jgi:hypothetical protein
MRDKLDDAKKEFEALKKSSGQLNDLRIQIEQAQEQHARLIQQFLQSAERNPSHWEFKIIQGKRTVAEIPFNKQAQEIFAAVNSSFARIRPGEGAGCPDRTSCTNIGQFGDLCFYLCHTVALPSQAEN